MQAVIQSVTNFTVWIIHNLSSHFERKIHD
jgi:hypothetical protein